MQYFPTVEEMVENHDWRLIVLTKAECPPEELEVKSMVEDREYSQCDEWRQDALERIETGDENTTVIMSGDTEYTPYGPEGEELNGDAAAEAMEAGYLRTLKRIQAAGPRTVVIRDNPTSIERRPQLRLRRHPAPRPLRLPPQASNGTANTTSAPPNASPETHLVSFIADICPGEVCRAVIGNALTYRDKDHLTATFARTLEPMLETDFREDGLAVGGEFDARTLGWGEVRTTPRTIAASGTASEAESVVENRPKRTSTSKGNPMYRGYHRRSASFRVVVADDDPN